MSIVWAFERARVRVSVMSCHVVVEWSLPPSGGEDRRWIDHVLIGSRPDITHNAVYGGAYRQPCRTRHDTETLGTDGRTRPDSRHVTPLDSAVLWSLPVAERSVSRRLSTVHATDGKRPKRKASKKRVTRAFSSTRWYRSNHRYRVVASCSNSSRPYTHARRYNHQSPITTHNR